MWYLCADHVSHALKQHRLSQASNKTATLQTALSTASFCVPNLFLYTDSVLKINGL